MLNLVADFSLLGSLKFFSIHLSTCPEHRSLGLEFCFKLRGKHVMGLWLLLRLLLGLELLLLLTFSRHVVVVTCLLSLITKNL